MKVHGAHVKRDTSQPYRGSFSWSYQFSLLFRLEQSVSVSLCVFSWSFTFFFACSLSLSLSENMSCSVILVYRTLPSLFYFFGFPLSISARISLRSFEVSFSLFLFGFSVASLSLYQSFSNRFVTQFTDSLNIHKDSLFSCLVTLSLSLSLSRSFRLFGVRLCLLLLWILTPFL